MSSNPLGPGTRNISTNVPNELYVSMYELASASGVKIGEFMRTLMRYAQDKQVKVRQNSEDKALWYAAIKEGNNPLPTVRLEVFIEEEEQFQEKHMEQLAPALSSRLLKPSLSKKRI